MDYTLVGIGVVSGQHEPRERIDRVQAQADLLLADLQDTVIEEPRDLAAGTSQLLDAFGGGAGYDGPSDTFVVDVDDGIDIDLSDDHLDDAADTEIEAAPVIDLDDDDLGLDTISTAPAVAQTTAAIRTPRSETPAPRSRFAGLWAAIKRWFSRTPAVVETESVDDDWDDESCAWTYTVSERRVAQVRAQRR